VQTPIERGAMADSSQEFVGALEAVVADLQAMYESKGDDYDQLTPVWHRMMFGNVSWAHEVAKKADRLTSLVMVELHGKTPNFDSLSDNVMDIAVYAVMWLAFMRVCKQQDRNSEDSVKPSVSQIREMAKGETSDPEVSLKPSDGVRKLFGKK